MGLLRSRHGRRDIEQTRPSEPSEQSITDATLFRLGCGLFGAILAFTAFDNLRNVEDQVEYADARNAPAPELTVPAVSSALLVGSIGVALWRVPATSAAAVAWFFVSVTPVMHDFWNEDDAEQRQQQFIQFLKNGALLGAALAFLGLGRREG